MAKTEKKAQQKPAKLGLNYFGIMLDYELDAVPGYWPVRNATSDIEELKRQLWVKGNPGMLPAQDWEASLKQCKSLSPQGTGQVYTGGIYAFTYIGEG
ncbi:hypothetical protein V1318_04260 [Lysobacter sp. CCNWLW3]